VVDLVSVYWSSLLLPGEAKMVKEPRMYRPPTQQPFYPWAHLASVGYRVNMLLASGVCENKQIKSPFLLTKKPHLTVPTLEIQK
jgi:hypothetical protein